MFEIVDFFFYEVFEKLKDEENCKGKVDNFIGNLEKYYICYVR